MFHHPSLERCLLNSGNNSFSLISGSGQLIPAAFPRGKIPQTMLWRDFTSSLQSLDWISPLGSGKAVIKNVLTSVELWL
jgi:hypothetical protein